MKVNGVTHPAPSDSRRLLSDHLRHDLGLTGTHVGCEHGVCGCCTVLFDGAPPMAMPDHGQHGLHALYRLYPCRSGWLFVAAGRDPDAITVCVAAPAYVGTDIDHQRDQLRWFGGMVGNHVADLVARYGGTKWTPPPPTPVDDCVDIETPRAARFSCKPSRGFQSRKSPSKSPERLKFARRLSRRRLS